MFSTDISGQSYRKKCLRQKLQCCAVCGHSEYTFDIVVHHIDGDRENNELDNLLPLCNSCHVKVHNVKAHNGRLGKLEESLPSDVIEIPDTVAERAREIRDENDFPSIGEAIRHMAQEGGYDV